MSVEAISWALAQKLDRSSAKFVLVALANCADADGRCWPSMEYLTEATCQDRKTVLENIRRLKESGVLFDTGDRRGRTGQVVVYALKTSENGTVKDAQKRNGSENGTVPKTDSKSTVFPVKESRFSAQRVPKTGHGTVIEPSIEPSGKQKKDKPAVVSVLVLTDFGFSEQQAQDFIDHKARVKAPLTERAWKDHLAECKKAGWTPVDAAEKVMARGWKGFAAEYVAAKVGATTPARHPNQSRQAALEARNRAVAEQFLRSFEHESS